MGGVCLSACWDTTPPPEADPPESRHPPGSRHTSPQEADPPQEAEPPGSRHPPPAQCMLGDTVNKRAVCILLECNLV